MNNAIGLVGVMLFFAGSAFFVFLTLIFAVKDKKVIVPIIMLAICFTAGLIMMIAGDVIYIRPDYTQVEQVAKTEKVETPKKEEVKEGEPEESEEEPESEKETAKQETSKVEKYDSKSNNVFHVGDTVSTKDLQITFVSSGEYKSDNQYIQPQSGNTFWKFKFKFENISDSEQSLSSLIGWNCYADDMEEKQTYIYEDTENDLSASLAPGRKIEGAVYFEVPKDSNSLEVEFKSNFLKSDRIIFIGK